MPEELTKVERTTTTERVANSLREAILQGRFAPGEKLPPERDLALSLGVTRVTLRSAIARLASSGLLVTVQGNGHRVQDVRTHGGLDRLPEMVSALERDHERAAKLVADLLALRRIVMAEACAIVCEKPESTWIELKAIADDMGDVLHDRAAFARHDQAFTRAVMRLSGNVAFELTWNTVVSLAEGRPELLPVLYEDPERLLLGVRALLALLSLGDADKTRELVRTALEGHDQSMITDALTKRKS
jgi:GntR family transcriptional regulator, transcriptional repressor for pyruvate dehydrogenase complex